MSNELGSSYGAKSQLATVSGLKPIRTGTSTVPVARAISCDQALISALLANCSGEAFFITLVSSLNCQNWLSSSPGFHPPAGRGHLPPPYVPPPAPSRPCLLVAPHLVIHGTWICLPNIVGRRDEYWVLSMYGASPRFSFHYPTTASLTSRDVPLPCEQKNSNSKPGCTPDSARNALALSGSNA